MLSCGELIFNKLTIFIVKKKGWVHGSRASQLRGNILAPVKSYLQLIRDVAVYSARFTRVRGKGRECQVTSDCGGTTQRKFSTGWKSRAIGSRYRFDTSQQGNLPRAIDRRLKIYGFMVLIEDTLEAHDKGFGRYRSWGSIELRKVYANGTWRVSQSSGRRLTPRHNSKSEFFVIDFTFYLTDWRDNQNIMSVRN